MVNAEKQEALQEFVASHVLVNESMLVEWLLGKGLFELEDIENLYPPLLDVEAAQCDGCHHTNIPVDEDGLCSECQTPQEIFEWWRVRSWLADQLKERGKPILINAYGTWWGRTCTGQAIFMDGVIEAIYDECQ